MNHSSGISTFKYISIIRFDRSTATGEIDFNTIGDQINKLIKVGIANADFS